MVVIGGRGAKKEGSEEGKEVDGREHRRKEGSEEGKVKGVMAVVY